MHFHQQSVLQLFHILSNTWYFLFHFNYSSACGGFNFNFLMVHEDEHPFRYLYMEGYFMFIDWNTQYYKVSSVLQVNVYMQCNPSQITSSFCFNFLEEGMGQKLRNSLKISPGNAKDQKYLAISLNRKNAGILSLPHTKPILNL